MLPQGVPDLPHASPGPVGQAPEKAHVIPTIPGTWVGTVISSIL